MDFGHLAHKYNFLFLDDNQTPKQCPATLAPMPYPKSQYSLAIKIQPYWNKLFHFLLTEPIYSTYFIDALMLSIISGDFFMGKLYELEKKYREHRQNIPILAIIRTDYLLGGTHIPQIKNVEVNTIAAGLGMLTTYLWKIREEQFGADNAGEKPTCNSVYVDGIVDAFKLWIQLHPNAKLPIFIMVVQPNERNLYDQMALIKELEPRGIRSLRLTLFEIGSSGFLNSDGYLIYNDYSIALAYFRAGYTPGDFNNEMDWKGRELLEASHCIECPSLALQFLGAKKVQQMITECSFPLQRLVCDLQFPSITGDTKGLLDSTFVKFFSFENKLKKQEAIDYMIKNPLLDFVLKPQREGGGNNIFGKREILDIIANEDLGTISQYILMENIVPPEQAKKACTLIAGDNTVKEEICISELGIFSSFISTSGTFLNERTGGYLLRTKPIYVNEGGVSSGYAFLDTPKLYDDTFNIADGMDIVDINEFATLE